jgi:hypothetical protein
MGFSNAPLGRPSAGYYPLAAAAPPPPPPPPMPAPVPAPVASAGTQPAWPMPPASTQPPPTTPGPTVGPYTPPSFGALAMLDLAKMIAHPWQTIKSFGLLTKDLAMLVPKRGLSVASAAPAMAQYAEARKHLEEAPFRKIFPFFEWGLDKWAFGRAQELAPEVQQRISERAWHPIQLEWPDGGKGHDVLTEVMTLSDVASKASDGQIVRAFLGANRLQFKNSTPMDYFYPMARSGDALILRRNLPLIPGQKSIQQTLTEHMNQLVQVHVQI